MCSVSQRYSWPGATLVQGDAVALVPGAHDVARSGEGAEPPAAGRDQRQCWPSLDPLPGHSGAGWGGLLCSERVTWAAV